MNADEMKRQAAVAVIDYLPGGGIVGVGTGSTVNHFIDAFAAVKAFSKGRLSSRHRPSGEETRYHSARPERDRRRRGIRGRCRRVKPSTSPDQGVVAPDAGKDSRRG